MKCKICNKPIKENTEGNLKYCQGHNLFEIVEAKKRERIEKDAGTPHRAYTY